MQVLEREFAWKDVSCVPVRKWREQTYSAAGDQYAWVWETVQGRDYNTRERHFAFFAVVSPWLDREGAQIVSLALAEHKVVLGLNCKTQLLEVQGLRKQEDESGRWTVWGIQIGGQDA